MTGLPALTMGAAARLLCSLYSLVLIFKKLPMLELTFSLVFSSVVLASFSASLRWLTQIDSCESNVASIPVITDSLQQLPRKR